MLELKRCPECQVPLKLSKSLKWNSGGEAYPRGSRSVPGSVRQFFFEPDVVNSIFSKINETIGVPIDHIVIESSRRNTVDFFKDYYSAWTLKLSNSLYQKISDKGFGKILGKIMFQLTRIVSWETNNVVIISGSGKNVTKEMVELKDSESFRTEFVRNPYSPLLYAGNTLAIFEVTMGSPQHLEYEDVGDNTYKFVVTPGEEHRELEERLQKRRFKSKPGDIVYECCPRCGIPSDLAKCKWDLEEGTITDPGGARISIFFNVTLEAVLSDLETELGEFIPGVVINTTTRYAKADPQKDEWMRDAASLRRRLAVRGLGNLTRFEMEEDGLSVTVENSCAQFLTIGIIQAVFETHIGKETRSLDWDLSDEGDLDVTVTCA